MLVSALITLQKFERSPPHPFNVVTFPECSHSIEEFNIITLDRETITVRSSRGVAIMTEEKTSPCRSS
jgi:hypothetical protein